MTQAAADLAVDALRIAVLRDAEGVLRLEWTGRSVDRAPEKFLAPFFADVTAEAAEKGASVELHFERLEYFNSSTINALIQLIRGARGEQVRLAIAYDPRVRWQSISFEALRVFERRDGLLKFLMVTPEKSEPVTDEARGHH